MTNKIEPSTNMVESGMTCPWPPKISIFHAVFGVVNSNLPQEASAGDETTCLSLNFIGKNLIYLLA